jgi:VWFA-related protein
VKGSNPISRGFQRKPKNHWLCWAVLCVASCGAAQQGQTGDAEPARDSPIQLIPRTKEQREERYFAQHRLMLNVQVSDSSGKPVPGLKPEDFSVLDEGQSKKIANFRAIDDGALARAHVLIVIDSLNNSSRGLAYERREIERFLHSSGSTLPYPTSLISLSKSGDGRDREATRDVNELLRELGEMAKNLHPVDCLEDRRNAAMDAKSFVINSADQGIAHQREQAAEEMGACLNERFTHSLAALTGLARAQADVPGRVILIWIGQGWPTLSGPHFTPDTPHLRQNHFDLLVQLSTALREAQITLDSLSWPEFGTDRKLDKLDLVALQRGTPTAAEATTSSLALPVIAYQTGGQVFDREKGLAADLARCFADADSYYVLSIDSSPSANTDEYHHLTVTTTRPGLTVRAVTGYYAQP